MLCSQTAMVGRHSASRKHISGQLETQYNKTKSPIRVLQMQMRAPLNSCMCSRMCVVELISKTGLYQAKQQFSSTDTPTVTSNQVQLLNHLLLIKTRSNFSD